MTNRIAASFVICGIILFSARQTRGDATVYWSLDNNGFQPSTVVIGPGEKVTWWNYDIYNLDTYVYFDNSFKFSLPNNSGMQVTFSVPAGVYGYQDNIGDRGTVIVNIAPHVAITSPADQTVLPAPATFTLQATASDTADDFVSDVQFFIGTNAIDDVFSPPFSTVVSNLDAGAYTLMAVASDSHGWTATNAITITVGASVPIQLSSPRTATGEFLFDVTGLAIGKTNIVQTSTDLALWWPVKTNIATSASMTVTNFTATGAHSYRIFQMP